MKTKFPIRKTDDKSTVIARDFSIFDAPVRSEMKFRFDVKNIGLELGWCQLFLSETFVTM